MQYFFSIWRSVDQRIKWEISDLHTEFWDLFSVNDIHTSRQLIDHRLSKTKKPISYVFILNCRIDRPLRTKYFIGMLHEQYTGAEIWVTGSGRRLALHLLRQKHSDRVIYTGHISKVINKIRKGFTIETLLFGIGNYKGMEPLFQQIKLLTKPIQN